MPFSEPPRVFWKTADIPRQNIFALSEPTPLHSPIMSVETRLPLSVAIITLNEERNLARCLESVRDLAAEIIVIDSGSTDGTRKVAEQFGTVFEVNAWKGQIAQCRVALSRCTQPWVLCLDADEALSPELKASLGQIFRGGEPKLNGFSVNRRTFYLGRWIQHVWYPEWRLRLARRSVAEWTGREPHYVLKVPGSTGRLEGDLLHYSFRDLQDHLQKSIKWARMSAYGTEQEARRFPWAGILFAPGITFFKQLIIKQGWREGWRGWLIAGVKMVNVFAKYAFIQERRWTIKNKDSA
jgi:glycosyltransferase involved in cell wall biosynthesis